MTWAYVWAMVFARKQSTKLFVPAVLMLGVLPDIDLFLRRFGVVHHTFTHSFCFWLVVFAPFLIVFQLKAIPYLAAVVQHFAFGDFLVGSVTIFWPFSTSFFGFDISMPSALDSALEVAGLSLAIGIICLNGDSRRLLSTKASNILMFFPSLALLASMLVLEVDAPAAILTAYTLFQSAPIAAILLAHIVMFVFLAVSTMQGFRGFVQASVRRISVTFAANGQ
jgi:membrane-bound metal-dependent hydrolase YbcI (DUF457 family)